MRVAGSSQAGEGRHRVEEAHLLWIDEVLYFRACTFRDLFLGRAEQLEQDSGLSLPVRAAILKGGHGATAN